MTDESVENLPRRGRLIELVNEERNFDISELFFSTTDLKGLIKYGNDVFVRVSGYSQAELIGEPHNIIRHPDMPRCVFMLLWDYIQSGKTIAAYVKNLAKDGRYYWVLAVISPIEDGYLAIRSKPCTDFKAKAEEIYRELLELEAAEAAREGGSIKAAMNASAERLREILRAWGFAGYGDFMRVVLSEELRKRDTLLVGRKQEAALLEGGASKSRFASPLAALMREAGKCETWLADVFSAMDGLQRLNQELQTKSEYVSDLAQSTRLLSLNAQIEASRLQEIGAAVSVIAENMARQSVAIVEQITTLGSFISDVFPVSGKIMVDVSAAKLKIEMASFFLHELIRKCAADAEHHIDTRTIENVRMLLIRSFGADSMASVKNIERLLTLLANLEGSVLSLIQLVRALEFIHISGRVEASRSDAFNKFGIIFDQVLVQVTQAKSELDGFVQLILSIRAALEEIRNSEGSLAVLIEELRGLLLELQ